MGEAFLKFEGCPLSYSDIRWFKIASVIKFLSQEVLTLTEATFLQQSMYSEIFTFQPQRIL